MLISPVTGVWLRAGRESLSTVRLSAGSIQTSLKTALRSDGLVVPK